MLAIEPAARPAGARELAARLRALRDSITDRNKVVARFALAAALVAAAIILAVRQFPAITVLPEKSIAVLPFESFSDEKENAYLADGIQDEIQTDLTKVADLKVIGRRSTEQFRGTRESAREIGRALGVSHVLEGAVRKGGGRIHVTTQLIDTRNETQTWAERYDRGVADIFLIQNDISQEVVSRLKAALSPAEKAAIEERPTRDKEAYDLYLRARALVYEFGGLGKAQAQDAAKAVPLLESAIAHDSNFSLAYCTLADAHLRVLEQDRREKARLAKAKEAIDAALRISPNSAEGHLRRARYFFQGADDADAAEKELAIAAAGLPGRVDVYSLRADIERHDNRWKEALRDALKAAELDPRDPATAQGLAEVYIPLRHYAEVERLIDHMLVAAPEKSIALFYRWKCWIALVKGDARAAMAALESSPYRNAGAFGLNHARAYVLILQRDYTRAEQLLQSIDATAKPNNAVNDDGNELYRHGITLETLGGIARFRGDKETARGYFEAARHSFEQWLANKPTNDAYQPWYESHALAFIAEIDAALGHKDDAIREMQSAVAYCEAQHDPWGASSDVQALLAIVYMWNGERGAAVRQLAEVAKLPTISKALIPGGMGITAGELKLNPIWDELRNDPRFDKIITEAAKPIKLE
jgi:TolB-like protein